MAVPTIFCGNAAKEVVSWQPFMPSFTDVSIRNNLPLSLHMNSHQCFSCIAVFWLKYRIFEVLEIQIRKEVYILHPHDSDYEMSCLVPFMLSSRSPIILLLFLPFQLTLGGHTGWVRAVATYDKYLFSCGCNYLRQWDCTFATPKELNSVKLFTGEGNEGEDFLIFHRCPQTAV